MRNILVLRNDRFGEFLLNIPALRALRETYPEARLTLVVNPSVRELAASLSLAERILEWSARQHSFWQVLGMSRRLRKMRFDAALMLNPSQEFNLITYLAGIPLRAGYCRKWPFLLNRRLEDKKYLGLQHEVEYNLQLAGLLGAKTADTSLRLPVDFSCSINLPDEFIVIHPFTSDPLKQWPPERFRELACVLQDKFKQKVVVVGLPNPAEGPQLDFGPEIIDLTAKTSLVQLAGLLKKAKLLISGDSGPVHLACVVGTPVIALFRNDLAAKGPRRWGPWGNSGFVLENKSLEGISAQEILAKAEEVLKR
jgi:ADP-heptose:LPS heptosyltransferase